ncbi:DNA primase, partial [Xenorhabdus bovienii]|nr:DNA primase [Xenorhabdus bovienii]
VFGESDYLKRKGLHHPVRLLSDGTIILPVQRGDELTGGQTIKPDGKKRFITGTKKKGSFTPLSALSGSPDTVLIAEGYATTLTVS